MICMSEKAGKIAEKAMEYHKAGYNCAESVLKAVAETFELEDSSVPMIATGFGGGIGRQGLTCGALTGSVMSIGLIVGRRTADETEKKAKAYELTARFLREFEDANGSTLCKELIGVDISTEEGFKKAVEQGIIQGKCNNEIITSAVKILDKVTIEQR